MSYYSVLAPLYDAFMEDFPYARYASLCVALFEEAKAPVKSVLDLACGTGTLACLLAEKGYDLVACDASPEMLGEAMKKGQGGNPLFICQEMAELDLFGTVSAAVCSLDGINHIPPEALEGVFSRLRLFVEPGGPFIFDVNTEGKLINQDGACFCQEVEGALCIWQAEFSQGRSDFYTELFRQEGKLWRRESAFHSEYVHRPEELEKALLAAGFSRAHCLGELLEDVDPGREFWLAEA